MTSKRNVPTVIQISGIWADVMRKGLKANNDQNDAEWWLEHQKEIEFALGVLAGLGLAGPDRVAKDGQIVWAPSRAMKRLHRYSRQYYCYRDSRNAHLQANVARRLAVVASLDQIKTAS